MSSELNIDFEISKFERGISQIDFSYIASVVVNKSFHKRVFALLKQSKNINAYVFIASMVSFREVDAFSHEVLKYISDEIDSFSDNKEAFSLIVDFFEHFYCLYESFVEAYQDQSLGTIKYNRFFDEFVSVARAYPDKSYGCQLYDFYLSALMEMEDFDTFFKRLKNDNDIMDIRWGSEFSYIRQDFGERYSHNKAVLLKLLAEMETTDEAYLELLLSLIDFVKSEYLLPKVFELLNDENKTIQDSAASYIHGFIDHLNDQQNFPEKYTISSDMSVILQRYLAVDHFLQSKYAALILSY